MYRPMPASARRRDARPGKPARRRKGPVASPGIPAPHVMGQGSGNALRKRRRRPTLEPMGSEGNVPRPIRLSARIAADLHNNALVPFPWVKSQAQAITRLLSNAAEGEASLLHPARAGVASAGRRGASSAEPEETREEVLDRGSRRRDRRALPEGTAAGRSGPLPVGRRTRPREPRRRNRIERDGTGENASAGPIRSRGRREGIPGAEDVDTAPKLLNVVQFFVFFGHAFLALSGAVRCWGS